MNVILNAYWERIEFELPEAGGQDIGLWHRWTDTALDLTNDIADWEKSPFVSVPKYPAQPRSVVVLIAREEAFVA